MAKILVLFAHPALEKSRVHTRLIKHIPLHPEITFHDLYERYPDFHIDIEYEQQLLLQHDVFIFQHPFYWYSAPALIKQWLDLVLEHGWAYGSGGNALSGKFMLNAISCGGSLNSYQPTGKNRRKVREFLLPFHHTATLCKMDYWPPFVIHGTHNLSETDMDLYALQYEQFLLALAANRFSVEEKDQCNYLNDLIPIPT
ncbi:MAG TPA: NAD(P)H-dependent oxidoreductase, partial [Chitinophagaceae bacterium]